MFELRDCPNCRRSFVINIYETSTDNSTLASETIRYRQVSRVTAEDVTGLTSQKRTIETNFTTEAEGFYIAIQDEASCFAVQRLIVFYNVCPGGPNYLTLLPETIAPRIERVSQPVLVGGQCVDQANPIIGGVVRLYCYQRGVWHLNSDSGCRCNTGYYASANRTICIGMSFRDGVLTISCVAMCN
jgi:hypothetical protein